uniref:transcription factor HIVEP3-like n=1 Tax=Pristiophorus japonicus TaxID=55135 RepID=UPI00398F50D8
MAVPSHCKQRRFPRALIAAKERRRPSRSKLRYSSGSARGHRVDELYTRGCGRGKHMCKECGICCKKPSTLKMHLQTHINVRPYHCKLCERSFKTKGNLTKHIKSKIHRTQHVEPQACTGSVGQDPADEDGGQSLKEEEQLLKRLHTQAASRPTQLHAQLFDQNTPLSTGGFAVYQPGESVPTLPASSSSATMVSAPPGTQSPTSAVTWALPVSEASDLSLCSQLPVCSFPSIAALSPLHSFSMARSSMDTACVWPVIPWATVPQQSDTEALPQLQTSPASYIANLQVPETPRSVTMATIVVPSSGTCASPTAATARPGSAGTQRRPSEAVTHLQGLQATAAAQSQASQAIESLCRCVQEHCTLPWRLELSDYCCCRVILLLTAVSCRSVD